MKLTKVFALLFLVSAISRLSAQTVKDSVSMEANYAKQVFYSLENGVVASSDINNWDLAFATYNRGAAGSAILINESYTSLWAHPGDTADWSTFDSTGFNKWDRYLNSDTSWTNGALNTKRGTKGMFDMGWGVLHPSNNYWTFGHSLYLVKLSNNTFKKLWIVSLKTGVWEFKYANLDGSNEKVITIKKSDYKDRNFVYHSMLNDSTLDREPDNTAWDLTFMKHVDFINPPGMYVNASSIFNNRNVWSAKSEENDYAAASSATEAKTEFNQNINNIGRSWKRFSSSTGWTVYDHIAYFVYDNDSSKFYRMVFTGFGGSQTGKAYFDKTLLKTVGIEPFETKANLSIYPNPSSGTVNLLIDYPQFDQIELHLSTLDGKTVYSSDMEITPGVNQKTFEWSHLPGGLYILTIGNDHFRSRQKLILD